jgi:hypothetical protein
MSSAASPSPSAENRNMLRIETPRSHKVDRPLALVGVVQKKRFPPSLRLLSLFWGFGLFVQHFFFNNLGHSRSKWHAGSCGGRDVYNPLLIPLVIAKVEELRDWPLQLLGTRACGACATRPRSPSRGHGADAIRARGGKWELRRRRSGTAAMSSAEPNEEHRRSDKSREGFQTGHL